MKKIWTRIINIHRYQVLLIKKEIEDSPNSKYRIQILSRDDSNKEYKSEMGFNTEKLRDSAFDEYSEEKAIHYTKCFTEEGLLSYMNDCIKSLNNDEKGILGN